MLVTELMEVSISSGLNPKSCECRVYGHEGLGTIPTPKPKSNPKNALKPQSQEGLPVNFQLQKENLRASSKGFAVLLLVFSLIL